MAETAITIKLNSYQYRVLREQLEIRLGDLETECSDAHKEWQEMDPKPAGIPDEYKELMGAQVQLKQLVTNI